MLTIEYKISKEAQLECAAKALDAQDRRVIQSNDPEDIKRAIGLGAIIDWAGNLKLDIRIAKRKLLKRPWSSERETDLDQVASSAQQAMNMFEANIEECKKLEAEQDAKEEEQHRESRKKARETLETWLKNPKGCIRISEVGESDPDKERVSIYLNSGHLPIDRDDAFLDLLRAAGDRLRREQEERKQEEREATDERKKVLSATRFGYASLVSDVPRERLTSGTIPEDEMKSLVRQGMLLWLQEISGVGWQPYQLMKMNDIGCDCREGGKFWSEETGGYPQGVWVMLRKVQAALKDRQNFEASVREHHAKCSHCNTLAIRYSIRIHDNVADFHISLGITE